jgi:hypothetical protein
MAISQAPTTVANPLHKSTASREKTDGVVIAEVEIPSSPAAIDATRYLVVSPYTEPAHLLDLHTLDVENQLLAQALINMTCLRADYATAPYLDTFNWATIVDEVRALARSRQHEWKETSFFIVAFRSQIPPTTVYAELGVLDKAAHAEATASGGFLK